MNLISKELHTISIIGGTLFFLRSFNKSIVRRWVFLFMLLSFRPRGNSRSFSRPWFWLRNCYRFASVSFSNKFRLFWYSCLACPVFPTSNFLLIFNLFHFFVLSCFIHAINILICPVCQSWSSISIGTFCYKFWGKCTFLNTIILLKFFLLFDFVFFIFLPQFVSFKKVHLR